VSSIRASLKDLYRERLGDTGMGPADIGDREIADALEVLWRTPGMVPPLPFPNGEKDITYSFL